MRALPIALAALLLTTSCADGDGAHDGSGEQSTQARQQAALTSADLGGAAGTTGVSVVGEGRVSGAPDTLTATVGVEVVRATVDGALSVANVASPPASAATERARAVIDAGTGGGLPGRA